MDDSFPKGMVEEIEAFLAADREPRGKDVYDSVFASGLFFPLQRKRELAAMMRTARSIQPRVVMEIGSDKGGGFYHWVKCLPTVTHAICCEVRGAPYEAAFRRAFPDVCFLFLSGSSYGSDVVEKVAVWLDGMAIDCLFIDGDKSHFLDDFHAYLPGMSCNGIVFMHDVVDKPMRSAFMEASKGFKHDMIHDVSEVHDRGPDATAHDHWLTYWDERSCGVGVIRLG